MFATHFLLGLITQVHCKSYRYVLKFIY